MTVNAGATVPTIRAAGRDWTPAELEHLRAQRASTMLGKEIAAMWGVDPRRFETPVNRAKLGIGPRPKHGGNNSRGHLPPAAKGADPLVRQIYDIINTERDTVTAVAARAGVGRQTITFWGRELRPEATRAPRLHDPRLSHLRAVVEALGYKLVILPEDADVHAIGDALRKGELTL